MCGRSILGANNLHFLFISITYSLFTSTSSSHCHGYFVNKPFHPLYNIYTISTIHITYILYFIFLYRILGFKWPNRNIFKWKELDGYMIQLIGVTLDGKLPHEWRYFIVLLLFSWFYFSWSVCACACRWVALWGLNWRGRKRESWDSQA